jgi:hypothetical protein
VDTVASAQITPTVIRYHTQLRYEILQAPVVKLEIALPASHALTKVQGDQIRDWSVKPDGNRQGLVLEFVKPVEKSYALTLLTEQPVEATLAPARFDVPQPLNIERESGTFSLSADDMIVEVDSITGLRQINAASGALAAYRFYGRPFALAARLKRVEPVLKVADRIIARLEETRWLVQHALTLNVEKPAFTPWNSPRKPTLSWLMFAEKASTTGNLSTENCASVLPGKSSAHTALIFTSNNRRKRFPTRSRSLRCGWPTPPTRRAASAFRRRSAFN